MFDEKTLSKVRQAEEDWEKASAKIRERVKPSRTTSGIPLKFTYTPQDINHLDWESDIGMPGAYPYTRSIYPIHYQFQPWMMQQVHGYGTAKDTRAYMEHLMKQGMEGYFGFPVFNIVFDVPSMYGIDPVHPESAGNIGVCGASMATSWDFDDLVDGLDLNKTNMSLITADSCLPTLAHFVAAAERKGFESKVLKGNSMNWFYRIFVQDTPAWPPKAGTKLMGDLIKYCTENMPYWNTTNLFGYGICEGGATPVQELGYIISWGIAAIQSGVDAGLNPDDFVPRFGFQIGVRTDFFEEICKLRALRRMWAKVTKERFGCQTSKSHFARIHVHTSGSDLVAQQPLNNTARITLQALAAVIGGVNSIHTCSYDETISIPTKESALVALRTQQILMFESNVPAVTDPLAGSYFIESLTNQLEAEAWKIVEKVDKAGGFVKSLEEGWMKKEIDNTSYETKKAVENKKKIMVGINRYKMEDEPVREDFFRLDPEVEKSVVKRYHEFLEWRDSKKTEAALKTLRDKATAGDFIMPALVDAARNNATMQEMMDIMREAYGWVVTE